MALPAVLLKAGSALKKAKAANDLRQGLGQGGFDPMSMIKGGKLPIKPMQIGCVVAILPVFVIAIAVIEQANKLHLIQGVDTAYAGTGSTGSSTAGASVDLGTGEIGNPIGRCTTITSNFGARGGDYHWGIDLGEPTGTPYYAAADGTVILAGDFGTCGTTIHIDHGKNSAGKKVYTWYCHSSKIHVKVNDKVKKGDHIGDIGSTGYSSGPHLHFQINIDGNEMNNGVNPATVTPTINFTTNCSSTTSSGTT